MSSSILLRNNVFNSLLAFFFLKLCNFSSFQRFLCWETIPSSFLSKFSFEIYLSPIINYWGRVFNIYLKWEAFSLVCVLSLFFFLSSFFSFSIGIFLWQTLTIHRIVGKAEGIIIFLYFHFYPVTNIYRVHRDFYHFALLFNRSICNYQICQNV